MQFFSSPFLTPTYVKLKTAVSFKPMNLPGWLSGGFEVRCWLYRLYWNDRVVTAGESVMDFKTTYSVLCNEINVKVNICTIQTKMSDFLEHGPT